MIVRRFLYTRGILPTYSPKIKTISVGNVVGGGSGKTPFTIYLAENLTKRGFKVAISHRGYKGEFESENVIIADENGIKDIAYRAGDEPLLLCQKLPKIPVVVGKNRRRSIGLLQERYPDLDFIILDDSFQHLKVKKNFDLVLFNSITKTGNGFVYPAGILRESLSSLKQADLIIYNGEDIPPQLLRSEKKIFKTQYHVRRLYHPDGSNIDCTELKCKTTALISGIGQPKSFEQTLHKSGISFEYHYIFPDHYTYDNPKLLNSIYEEMQKRFNCLLTTEKDYTKLRNSTLLSKLVIVEIGIQLEQENDFFAVILTQK
jgi:tetraacyldisaccharide 4'-kinase